MHSIPEKAVEQYRRQRFLEDVNAAYAALSKDPEAWKSVQEERSAWEVTLGDGLLNEIWTVEGAPAASGAGDSVEAKEEA
jgi:hypothetical protein